MTDLTLEQIEDELKDYEIANLSSGFNDRNSNEYKIAESLAACRIENKRLKKEADKDFQRGRVIGLAEAVQIVKDTTPEHRGSRA